MSRENLGEPLVIKFGGTSVGDGAAFERAARIAAEEAMVRPTAVVVSAMSGVTDALLGYAKTTETTETAETLATTETDSDSSGRISSTASTTSTGATREGSLAELHRALYSRHIVAARRAVSQENLPRVEKAILTLLGGLLEHINDEEANFEARAAEVATYGERLSAEILAGAIKSLGVDSAVAGDPIVTDSEFAAADICPNLTYERCRAEVASLLGEGVAAVVPGYVGRSPLGRVTTLGRGGSDLSGTAIGRAIGASEVWIMSDVNGILDADPRLVPEAATLPQLSYREAHLFAGLGAKVLHHKTMEPVAEAGIEVRVRNTFEPRAVGTRISSRECGEGVRCVALRNGLAFETLEKREFEETPQEDVFCVLGTDGREMRVLLDDDGEGRESGEVAAIVGVGSPTDADFARGLRGLESRGFRVLWAGNAAAGLVFVVEAEVAEEALRALHGSLVGPRVEIGEKREAVA